MAECIHGFEDGLCDICFPRQAPESARSATASPRAAPRRRPTKLTAPEPSVPRFSAPSVAPTVSLARQRVYHVTHLANLDRIFDTGELRPSVAGEGAEGAEPAIDVSSATARELRATIEVVDQRSVAQYVPFYLSPDATRWNELRTGGVGVHWSDDARASTAADYVVLVAPLSELGPDTAIAGGDAAGPVTRFALGDEENLRMLRRLHAEDGPLNDAEALAVEPVAVTSFALIGVANDPIRDRVRAMLRSAGLTTKVSVYPPWFQPAEEE